MYRNYNKKCDYHLRSIAPYVGVTEDPVCGTGNACVSSYIVHHNILDKTSFIGEQGNFINRPGKVYVNITRENNDITSVKIGGSAYTILSGEIMY
ncbi:phenazine biosynthesis-like family protein [Clostridioides difficile DA00232]|uniref:PhzF family phenazine biosynthesis protein n=1 Tax=Clostridioides difficile TaxID=1496 RepID=UPI00038DB4FF|nr:PhzF family phenazine biosynthesis protein [Clostridioides difficile]EQH33765.1 phenazine biosynthesis-like family protein [Clostridioides difficile DA00232]